MLSGCDRPVVGPMPDPVVGEGVLDIRNIRVDSIIYGKDGYVASLTQQDSGGAV